MNYRNHYARFVAVYWDCYNDIVTMMKNKGVARLEIPDDEDFGYDKVTIRNYYYCNTEEQEVAFVELVGEDLYFENRDEYSYSVRDVVEGLNITDLYDIVYRALYENNN